MRTQDTPARLGGDEFGVVCANIRDDAGLQHLARRLISTMNEPINLGDDTVQIGASVGVSVTHAADADPDRLLDQADVAMYTAKRGGRNRVCLHGDGVLATAADHTGVAEELRDAIRHGWLRLQYQPIVDVESRHIIAAEALLRIAHPGRGLLTAHSFMDVAEDSDLIVDIEQWVLDTACRQLAQWQEITPLTLAINVSGRPGALSATALRVADTTAQTGVAPADVSLEVTERVLLDATEPVARTLHDLHEQGVGITIDNFGAGHSSLTHLLRLSISRIKIDRSCTASLGHDRRSTAIVSAVTALGSALDLTVVAEGVENPRQLHELIELRCPLAQGYHIGYPVAPDEFTKLLYAQASRGSDVAQRGQNQPIVPEATVGNIREPRPVLGPALNVPAASACRRLRTCPSAGG